MSAEALPLMRRLALLLRADDQRVYRIARAIGKRLPLPRGWKIWAHELLLRSRYPEEERKPRLAEVAAEKLPQLGLGALRRPVMQPTRCGLRPGLVSVVLPVYNQADLLVEAIQSVLAQTYEELELILINDGSTDAVEPVLERFSLDPRVRCFTQPNRGLPGALSNGFRQARGEYWTWTSADNIMGPGMLAALVAKLDAEPDLGLVYADYAVMDDRGQPLQDETWRWRNRPNPLSAEVRLPHSPADLNLVQDNFIGPCFLYCGWIGQVLGDYDPQVGIEDYDYWMRVNAFFQVRHLGTDELHYRYRVHGDSLSARADELRILQKVMGLMDYERQRAADFQAPLTAAGDQAGRQWLQLEGLLQVRWTALDELQCPGLPDKAELALVSSATAVQHLQALAEGTDKPVAVLFDREDTRCQALRPLLRQRRCLALVADGRTASRIRRIAGCCLLDSEAEQSLVAVVAFARNYRSFSAIHPEAAQAPEQPRPLVRVAGQHLLLQVDSFQQGGLENVVLDLAQSIQGLGYQVTIANLGPAGEAAKRARAAGIKVKTFPASAQPERYVAWLQDEGVALVNAHYSLFAAAQCKAAGIPFIQTIHNAYVWLDPDALAAYREADAHTAAYACVSETAARYADEALGLDAAKMQVLPNGIDLERLQQGDFQRNRKAQRAAWGVSEDTLVFLNVASIMAPKAQLPLVKAFAQVLEAQPKARLVLLGEPMEKSYARDVRKAVRQLGIGKQVLIKGYTPNPAPCYQGADLFVLPSYWEGWSLSLAEALATGLPAVITEVGAAYEFADYPNVEILAPPYGDITALNYQNLHAEIYQEDPAFIASLAQAMTRAASKPAPRQPAASALAAPLDRAAAYPRYAALYQEFTPPPPAK